MAFGGLCPARAGQGGQAGAFLRQDVDARGAAMGGALTAVAEETAALHWNPAGLSSLRKPEFSATHIALFEGTSFDWLTAGLPLKRWGGAAVGYARQSTGGFERRAGPNDAPVAFAITQAAVVGGWGAALPGPVPLDVGVSVKSVSESIGETAASGLAADAGLIWRPGRFSLGALAANLVAPELKFVSTPVRYPRTFVVSPAYQQPLSKDWSGLAALKLSKTEDEALAPSLGLELRFRRWTAVRLGYQEQGLSTGLGLRWGNSQIDYAALLHDLGVAHLVSFTQRFGQTREELEATIRRGISSLTRQDGVRLSKAYLQKAEAEIGEDRIADSLRSFEAASLLDPGNEAIAERIAKVAARWDLAISRQMVERTAGLARQQQDSGNLLAGRQYWRSVLELEAAHAEAQAELAAIDAQLSADELLRLDSLRRAQSDNEVAQLLDLAESLAGRGAFRQAREEAKRAARRFPSEGRLAAFLAGLDGRLQGYAALQAEEAGRLGAAGDSAGALRLLEAALKEAPLHPKLSAAAAGLRSAMERSVSAEDRKKAEQVYYRGVESYLKGDYKTAAALAEEVLRLDPSSAAVRTLKEKITAAARINR